MTGVIFTNKAVGFRNCFIFVIILNKNNMRWQNIREIVRQVHLWIGLIGGIFIFIICLSGTILVFQDEVIEILNPDVFEIESTGETLPVTALQQQVETKTGLSVMGFALSRSTDTPAEFFVKKKRGKGRPETVYVNPFTAEILGNNKELVGKDFFMFNFRLHRWLMMDTEIGRPIVGFFTLAFVFATLTGLIIWFPRKIKYWRQGLKVKWHAGWKRVNHDFHNAFGLYSAIFLLILALSGLTWSFEWYKDGLSNVLGAKVFDRNRTEIKIDQPTEVALSLDQLVPQSFDNFKNYGTLRFNLPQKPDEALEVNAYPKGFAALSLPDVFFINPSNGMVIHQKLIADLSFGEKIAKSIHDLHMGYIYGMFSKIIFFISSLIATLLPITGILIWWNKRKKKEFNLIKIRKF